MSKKVKAPQRKVTCQPREAGFLLSFHAMASPCEVLVDCSDKAHALQLGKIAAAEAWRIEDKYSRYQQKSVCGQLNLRAGERCTIDSETYLLLKFADECFQMSEGLFDITSGVLRKAWRFDGSDNIPTQQQIEQLLPYIGWQKTQLSESTFTMQQGMEIDLGGLGKEYAVDRALQLINAQTDAPVLINFGGDLAVNKARLYKNQPAWQVGIDHPSFSKDKSVLVAMTAGAVATSGDANRFLVKDGQRYSHILNVKTGWPIENPPSAITVAAPQCIQAGFLSTLALLQGENAEQFLTEQEIKFWSIR
ncbi:MAG: FAD:protein FMN transferase [Alteromonadaceae bacterium]|nr:FAD:protein FMN transferase [Alteromonadaceae bacterium]